MNYEFPEIRTLKQVETAIHGRSEFVIAEREWGIVVNYNVAFVDTFAADGISGLIRRECRGIKFTLNGKILARPYHKFFNVNERPETQMDVLDFNKPFVILDKMDGSMIHPIMWNGDVVYCTKMGPTDVALGAQFFADNHKTARYNDMCREFCKNGFTIIFEWCSRKNRIVLDYPEDMLVLTAIRSNINGLYSPYKWIKAAASHYNIPVVAVYGDSFEDIHSFAETLRNKEDIEGAVIRWVDGMVKLKCLRYLELHKAKELMASEKDVWKVVLENKVDDVVGFMEPDEADRLRDFQKELMTKVDKKADELKWEVIAWTDNKGDSKKKFAVEFVNSGKFNGYEKAILFRIWDGHDSRDLVIEALLKATGTGTKLDAIRSLVGLKFETY